MAIGRCIMFMGPQELVLKEIRRLSLSDGKIKLINGGAVECIDVFSESIWGGQEPLPGIYSDYEWSDRVKSFDNFNLNYEIFIRGAYLGSFPIFFPADNGNGNSICGLPISESQAFLLCPSLQQIDEYRGIDPVYNERDIFQDICVSYLNAGLLYAINRLNYYICSHSEAQRILPRSRLYSSHSGRGIDINVVATAQELVADRQVGREAPFSWLIRCAHNLFFDQTIVDQHNIESYLENYRAELNNFDANAFALCCDNILNYRDDIISYLRR